MSKPLYQSITNEILEYHANPVYNNISVEKTLRNNSWVQISNEYYYVGNTTMNNNKTSIGTQLRDKKNQFEIAGNFNLKSQGKFSVADGSFKIGKINSALTYGISHYTIPKAQRAFLYTSTMPFIVSPFIVSQTYAHITKKDFSPSNNHWLNTSRSIRFSYIKNNSQLQNFPYITLGASGIDRRFRHLSANFTFSPVKMDKILDFTDIQLNTEGIYFPIGGDVYFTSDQRKRFRWSSNIGSKWAIGSDQTNVNAAFNSYWVPSKLFSFSLRNSLDLNNNQTKAFPSVANRLLENYDNLNIENSLNVAFTPMPKFSITTYFLNQYISAFNRQLFELKNDGSIVKTDDIFEYNPKNKHVATIGGRIEYLFTTNSMLYLSINGALTNEIARPFFAPPTTAEIPNTIHNSNINLSFIWNIGKY